MSILSVVRDVCATVGVLQSQSMFANITGNRTMQEMLSLANEMAQRIAYDTRDWARLKTTQTYVGDGVTTAWALPNNYKRMLLSTNVWRSTSQLIPMSFMPDTDDWLNHRLSNFTGSYGEWTLLGGQMHIYPIMPVGESAYYAYLDKNCVALASGGFGDTFQADLDGFVLDERILKLGMIWEWKARKGGAYAEDMATYGDAISKAQGADGPAPIIVGRRPISYNNRLSGKMAGPWP